MAEQVHEYENLVADILAEGMKMCEVLQVNVLIEKLPESWARCRNHLKHKKKDLTLEELVSHLKIEEANRLKEKETSITAAETVKANIVESSQVNKKGNKPPFNKKNKKGPGGQNNKPAKFKKNNNGEKQNNTGCYVCGRQGHRVF